MAQITLRKNMRYFEGDDTDFVIQAGEIKELPEKHLRSYSIKHHLFHGHFRLQDGEIMFNMKDGIIYINKDSLYCKSSDKYFTKDLDEGHITFIAEEFIPRNILIKLNPEASAELLGQVQPTQVQTKEVDIDTMSRDALISYIESKKLKIDTTLKINKLREEVKWQDIQITQQ